MPFDEIEKFVLRIGYDSNEEYNLLTNNCQDFANKILEHMEFQPVVTQVGMFTKNPIQAVGRIIKKIL